MFKVHSKAGMSRVHVEDVLVGIPKSTDNRTFKMCVGCSSNSSKARQWKGSAGTRHSRLVTGANSVSAMQCKLFDTLVLPILSYACEVWVVNPSVSEAAGALQTLQALVRCQSGVCPVLPFKEQLLTNSRTMNITFSV